MHRQIIKGDGRAGSHEEDLSSPNSSSTILGPHSENDRKLPHRSRIDVNSKSNNIFRHTRLNHKDSPSTHYLSPSLLNSPVTARLEGFSPILSPVRENKTVEESWRNESSYLASGAHIPSKDEPVSPLSSPYRRRSLAGFHGSPRVANNRRKPSSPGSGSQGSVFTSRGNSTRDKALPPLPYSSHLARRAVVETFKGQSNSTPIDLGDGSLMDSPKSSKVTRSGYLRISSGGATLAQSPSERRHYSGVRACGPGMNSSREGFRGLESRTPTPVGRVVDDKAIQERHTSLGERTRVSFFSTKTSMTTTSESSVVDVTKYSQSMDQQQQNVICTPPRKAAAGNIYQTPRGAHQLSTSLHYDDLNPSPKRYNARFSITPSLLSSPEGKGKFGAREGISEDGSSQRGQFPRENSAASTIFSVATNSTGDIPNLAPGIFSDSNRRRYSIPRAPRLIEITKNPYGGSIVVPVDEGCEKQPKAVSDTVKSVDMVDEGIEEIHNLAASKNEKGIDSATRRSKSYGETSKKLSAQNSAKRSLSYGNDSKSKEATRKDTKKCSSAIQGDSEGARKDLGPKKHGAEKVLVANVAKTSPKPKGDRVIQRPTIPQPLVGGGQKNTNTEGQTGVSSLGRSFRRALGNGSSAPATSSGVGQGNARKTEKSYMRPLVKNELSTPCRNISSGALSATSNKSSARFGGQPSGRKGGEKTLLSQKNSKSVDSLRRQKITQDAMKKDKTPPAATSMSKSGGKVYLTIPTAGALEELTEKSTLEVAIETDISPSKFKDSLGSSNGGMLMDITGIGSGSNPRTTPVTSRNWFGRRGNETLLISRPVPISGLVSESYSPMDSQKENSRPLMGNYQQYPQPQKVTPKAKTKPLGNLTSWLSSSKRLKGKSSPLTPNGHFFQEEVDDLIKRLSAQIPQSPGLRNGSNVLGGRYYSSSVPSLEKSPSKDEKDRNPIAVCMDLINAASNEPQSPKRESLLQMSRVMVDAVSKSRDAECAAEEAKMAANRAEMAFLETRKHLAEMTEMMKHKKEEI